MPRENHERGLPLATLSFESKGMLKDRVYGIRETLFHDPYYQRHVVGGPLVAQASPRAHRERGELRRLSHQADELSTVFNVGRYLDASSTRRRAASSRARTVVYDSEMIPNSIIYPI